MSADQLRAFRRTAEREIERFDRELEAHPNHAESAHARREWAKLAYFADGELRRLEAMYDH